MKPRVGRSAGLPGIVDYFTYPSAARGVPMRHAFLSTLGLLLMVAGWWLRRDDPTSVVAISLSGIAVVAMVASRRIGMRLTPAAPLRVTK